VPREVLDPRDETAGKFKITLIRAGGYFTTLLIATLYNCRMIDELERIRNRAIVDNRDIPAFTWRDSETKYE
jgi:hypothetical protein